MINREIPFRPRLEGEFRVRFYNAASEITEKTPTLTIARIAEREIEWVEKDCQYNIEQRKKYRAVWFLFRDLIRASWKACYRNGVIYMSLPTLNGTDMHDTTSPEVKALLRSWMSESRHERLVGYTDFINRMENPGTNKQSIAALIADGDELEKRIKRVHTGEIAIEAAVQPYLQLVRENDRDVFTGLKTSEIWRYFRLTWSTPVETTPGRTMQYLIRDAAHPMHAVMGIASLENCAVQITCRDDYIGWNQKAFIERIVTVDNDRAKEEFKQLLVYPRTTYNGSADMTAVVSTIQDGMVQWLVAADRDTNNYDPNGAIPIGEMQYDRRMVNVWASSDSRIITQYLTMLRTYNLYPKPETLIGILKNFGHIASNGLISIPKFGADTQAIDNKKKGLIGTLFAASWYTRNNQDSLVASLDDDKARLWLQDSRFGNERADLVGLKYIAETNTLLIQPIEVKTRDESPDATITKSDDGRQLISGHAAGQIASIVGMLKEIFSVDENSSDMFISARREVLKYQIVSECFRNVHDSEWQKRWCGILKKAFGNGASGNINIQVSGLLMHIKLSEVSGGKVIQCAYADGDEGPIEYRGCPIEYRLLTAKEIQQEVLGEDTILKEPLTADYDSDETPESNEEGTVVYEFGNPSYSAEMREQTKSDAEQGTAIVENGTTRIEPIEVESQGKTGCKTTGVSSEEIEQLVKDFKRSCGDYHVALRECEAKSAVVGPSVIRIKFKLGRGQALQGLASHLEDIGREMKRTGVIIQQVPNSDELLLDVPRLQREKVLFKDVISSIPKVTSPEQLLFPLGRTPNGKDLIEDLSQMPHMLVGGSTGSGKSVFLFSMLAALLMTHPEKEDMQLILSSSKLEDFIHFEGLPHLYSGRIISDATEATKVIKEVIFEESERRGRLLAEARVANIVEYNKKVAEKLAPIVVVIDEFADLADQLETTKEKNAFYKPVQRIAQAGRSRGIHLVICTQRPEAKLVPSTTKAQLNGRVALRVNDGISSRMIIEEPDAQYLQKHGDMIYRNGDIIERAQGYLIEIEELDKIVDDVIHGRI